MQVSLFDDIVNTLIIFHCVLLDFLSCTGNAKYFSSQYGCIDKQQEQHRPPETIKIYIMALKTCFITSSRRFLTKFISAVQIISALELK